MPPPSIAPWPGETTRMVASVVLEHLSKRFGAFTAVDILGEVSGIGDVLLEQLRPLIAI